MTGIDREVSAVHEIAKDLIRDAHGAVVASDVPLVCIRPRHGERLALAVERLHVVNVLRKFVYGVPPGGRAAHARLQRSGGHTAERYVNARDVVLGRGERHLVNDRRLAALLGIHRGADNEQTDQRRDKAMTHKSSNMMLAARSAVICPGPSKGGATSTTSQPTTCRPASPRTSSCAS